MCVTPQSHGDQSLSRLEKLIVAILTVELWISINDMLHDVPAF